MLRLIKAELYVLFKTRTFKVLCAIALFLAIGVLGLTKLMSSEEFIKSSLKGMSPEQQEQFMDTLQSAGSGENDSVIIPGSGLGFHIQANDIFKPTAKETYHAAFGSGIIEMIMAVLIGAMVAKEYSTGTIKNILAYGKRREYYYVSKLIACAIGLAAVLGIILVVATIGGITLFGWGEAFSPSQALGMLMNFLGAMAVGMGIISVLMLIATLVKSSGATIGIGIVTMAVLPMVISFLYGKFDWFDKMYQYSLSYNWALATSIKSTNGDILKAIIVGLLTLLIATGAGIGLFRKQDIK
ncbi:ABC transporter permease subunit [Clostridium cellulovorans]|uniref:ABC-2 type transporter n=1 Tax=Clostridium cellulovorans (strain ATCC 35296 / DSM 3052 / OCM 3 / 743B) TaxID=573061 RepID=D9SN72_CLOC7|nr:ABC transporter permease subunit [Clostridium cellulovorans]ADL53864.1 hypothetical protein Clocel_4203 [Clostridium cellulovorans 743B]